MEVDNHLDTEAVLIDEDGLLNDSEKENSVQCSPIKKGKENGSLKGSPLKKVDDNDNEDGDEKSAKKSKKSQENDNSEDGESEGEKEEDGEDEEKEKKKTGGWGSCEPSPCHSWISNTSSCTNLFGEEIDEEMEGDGGEDDYEYDPYTHEYVPRLKEPPPGEDSDDGLLVSREQRNRALSYVAQALLESAKLNQEKWEEEQRYKKRRSSLTQISCVAKLVFSSGKALCHIEEMPDYLRFNKHIRSGYRQMGDFWSCVRSLFSLHNECLNIWVHMLPIIYVVLFWEFMFPWDKIGGNAYLNMLGWTHIAASISPWIGSVIYHLFMNYRHETGEKFYQFLLQIDMFGIWITECFGALANLTAAAWCLPNDYQTAVMTAYGLAAVWGLQKAVTAKNPVARRMCFAPVFISRILAFILRLSPWGGGNPNVLMDVILQDALSVAGGIIGVLRIPEKWFPGRFDLWLNSHHIMHIMVVWAVIHMNNAANGDVHWVTENYQTCPAPGLPVS